MQSSTSTLHTSPSAARAASDLGFVHYTAAPPYVLRSFVEPTSSVRTLPVSSTGVVNDRPQRRNNPTHNCNSSSNDDDALMTEAAPRTEELESTGQEKGENFDLLWESLEHSDWSGVLQRLPASTADAPRCPLGRTPLHVACAQDDTPAVVVRALLRAWPKSATMVGTSRMTPLHIACSSHRASGPVVRALLEEGPLRQTTLRDVDGDTPLHAACRCGASPSVLELLLRANPTAVHERDAEGLTPLLRLWVRVFVLCNSNRTNNNNSGSSTSSNNSMNSNEPLASPAWGDEVAWRSTEMLLQAAHYGCLAQPPTAATPTANHINPSKSKSFLLLHCAAAVDCPRAVVQRALQQGPDQVALRDENGLTALHWAAQAPKYPNHDLTPEFGGEHVYDDDQQSNQNSLCSAEGDDFDYEQLERELYEPDAPSPHWRTTSRQHQTQQPSVLQVLCTGEASTSFAHQAARIPDAVGRLPLHLALDPPPHQPLQQLPQHQKTQYSKQWEADGLEHLVNLYPEAVAVINPTNQLVPFLQAAAAAPSSQVEDDDEALGQIGTIYHLLRQQPSVLQVLWEHSVRPRRSVMSSPPATP